MSRIQMIPRSKVAVTFYVRKAPDRDRVSQFVELYRAGAQMPPIVVNKDMELIDGRHRLEAQKELHRRMIPIVIEDINDRADMIVSAIAKNSGGALPQTDEDYVFSAMQLLEAGKTRVQVIKIFSALLPIRVAQRYVANGQSNLASRRMNLAVKTLAQGDKTVKQVAKEFNIKPANLQAAIRGRQKSVVNSDSLSAINTSVSVRYRSLSSTNANLLKQLFQRFEDGELSDKVILAVIAKMKTMNKKSESVVSDYENRFKTLTTKKKLRIA